MVFRASILLACLLLASAATAETVYKYRLKNGQTTYSNRLIPNAELIETFEYKFAAPVAPHAPAASRDTPSKGEAAVDERMKTRIAALDAAWAELQEATRAWNVAVARLAAGVGPLESDNVALGGPDVPAPADVGGPQKPASPEAGGPQPPAPPKPGQTVAQAAADARQVGGPMGTRRGGGRNAEYGERLASLEADVVKARARLDAAQARYNALR